MDAALTYYDELMPLLGYERCFGNGYCPEGSAGTQIFLYDATGGDWYSRHEVGLQHLAFLVPTRSAVQRVLGWAAELGHEIVREPHARPQYGPDCYAGFFLDLHGFMIEVITHDPVNPA